MTWKRKGKDFQKVVLDILKGILKCFNNARLVQDVKNSLIVEVTSAIEDLKDKRIQLVAQENEFQQAMAKVQQDSMQLSEIEEWLLNKERELTVVRTSTDQIQRRLNEVRIEQALPSDQEEPLHKEQYAFLPGNPYTPNKNEIRNKGMYIFIGLFYSYSNLSGIC